MSDRSTPPRPLPYRLIATDLDGSLLDSTHRISARSRAALRATAQAGAAHIIVTGRSVLSTMPIFQDLHYRGLAVCGQGAQVYHAGEHRLLTTVTLDRRLAAMALGKIEAEVGPVAVAANRDGLNGEFLVGEGYRPYTDLPSRPLRSVDELWGAPLTKLFIQHPTLSDDQLAQVARSLVGHCVNVVMSGEGVVEVLPLGLTKATGLSLAARKLGLTARDTIAFGDMPNDIPMFRWAAHGVAMANAHHDLTAVADETTDSNDDDGIARVLERLCAM